MLLSGGHYENDVAEGELIYKYPETDRPGQKRFRFDVKKRYGLQCAVCDMSVGELLEAVHIRDQSENGSNDARNGLLLCRNHHKAFDDGLFVIEPESLRLETKDEGPALEEMEITRPKLDPLRNEPHEEALRWAWERWQDEHG